MSRVVAVCGKGGVGKTTVAALMARELRMHGTAKVLAVDADHAGGLSMALGMKPQKTVNTVRAETIGEIKKGHRERGQVAAALDYLLMQALCEEGNLALLSIGRPEEAGCYCSVNSLLREAVSLLAGGFDLTLIDAEAGIEQVSRKVMDRVDYLLLVSDPALKGLRVAEAIRDAADKLGSKARTGLLLNRVRDEQEASRMAAQTSLPVIGRLPEDETIREFDSCARSFLELPDCAASEALAEMLRSAGVLQY